MLTHLQLEPRRRRSIDNRERDAGCLIAQTATYARDGIALDPQFPTAEVQAIPGLPRQTQPTYHQLAALRGKVDVYSGSGEPAPGHVSHTQMDIGGHRWTAIRTAQQEKGKDGMAFEHVQNHTSASIEKNIGIFLTHFPISI
jgi:hypothetical protein